MRISILTLFPQMFDALRFSIIGRAIDSGAVDIKIFNIRDYSADKHKKCDDYVFGGGSGMLMTPQPVFDCISAADPTHSAHRIYLSPKGKVFCTSEARRIAAFDEVLLLCGHYEGIDQRVIDLCIDEEISIGDYILTGGELAAMVVCDAACRFLGGVLGNEESAVDESFSHGLLEYPQYTRPQEFRGIKVPDVLVSGNHEQIRRWRRAQSNEITKKLRSDLIKE